MSITTYNSLPLQERLDEFLCVLKIKEEAQKYKPSCSFMWSNQRIIIATKPTSQTLSNEEILSLLSKLFEDIFTQVDASFIPQQSAEILRKRVKKFIEQIPCSPTSPPATLTDLRAYYLLHHLLLDDTFQWIPSKPPQLPTAPEKASLNICHILNKPSLSKQEAKTLISCLKTLDQIPNLLLHIRKFLKYTQQRIEQHLKIATQTPTRVTSVPVGRDYGYIHEIRDSSLSLQDIRIVTHVHKIVRKWQQNSALINEKSNEFQRILQKIAHSTCRQDVKTYCYTVLDKERVTKSIDLQTPTFFSLIEQLKKNGERVVADSSLAKQWHIAACSIRISVFFSFYAEKEGLFQTQDIHETLQFRISALATFLQVIQTMTNNYAALSKEAFITCNKITQKLTASQTAFFSSQVLFATQQELKQPCFGFTDTSEQIASSLFKDELSNINVLVQPMKSLQIAPQIAKPAPAPNTMYKYHKRVTRWWSLDDKVNPFLNDPQYANCLPATQTRIRTEHAFALAVDAYARKEGFTHENQVTVLGELVMSNGTTRQGVFGFAFDDKKICYHRHFTEKAPDTLCSEILQEGYYKLNFPPLPLVEQQSSCETEVYHDGSYVESETEELAVIKNPQDGTTIRLCRFSDSE